MSIGNENQFASEVVDATLESLRDQRDDKQDIAFSGEVFVSPSLFTEHKKHFVQGPYLFESPFHGVPRAFFGQYTPALRSELQGATLISDYTPFLLQPYVYSWRFTNGVIDGFYIGLFAISLPSEPAASTHSVFWKVEGKGTAYPDERTTESWTESYNLEESAFLIDDGSMDSVTDDSLNDFPEGDYPD